MEDFRQLISDALKQKRPNLSATSLKTYVSILYNVSKKIDPTNTKMDIFENPTPIMELLKEKPPASRKTTLSALFVLTGIETFNKQMLDDCKVTNDHYRENKKTEKQEENWIELDEIKKIYDDLLTNVNAMFAKKLVINEAVVVNFLLLSFLGGISGLPPRRSLDYTELKKHLINYDEKKDNYYKNGVMYFNVYKTAKTYGSQTLDVKTLAPALDKILKKWVKLNTNEYMLFSSNGQKLTSPQVTKKLNQIFNGRKISTDILRHVFLTDRYGKVQEDMKETAKHMSHSPAEQALYIKR